MQREIKFRLWYHGSSMDYSNDDFAITMGGEMINYDSEIEGFVPISNGRFEYELMQFTNLKDKNGKEIYEGDIMGASKASKGGGTVRWSNGKFELLGNMWAHDIWFASKHYEVIGNIYQNKNLIQ